MIKNIIFDLGNVVVTGRPYSVLDDLHLDKKTYDLIKSEFFTDWDRLDKGTITLEEKLLSSQIPLKIQERYKEILLHYYKYRIFDSRLLKLMHELKKNNYNVYVLSDINKESIDYMRQHPQFTDVDGWIASSEHGVTKVEKGLYQVLFDTYSLDPHECYFIDDKPINISIGREYGMDGYVFAQDVDSLIADMQMHGIVLGDSVQVDKK